MKEVFIPDTDKRYSITEEGIVYSHYKYTNQGNKYYRRKIVKPYFTNNRGKYQRVELYYYKKRKKTIALSTLMESCFSLEPPDKHHHYDLVPIDGDYSRAVLSNLEYKIRTMSCNYYPKPYYDSNGLIVRKKCGACGEVKVIENFELQIPKIKSRLKTYSNVCATCKNAKKKDNLTNYYVASCLQVHKYGLTTKTTDPFLIDLGRKRILLHRLIKQNQ